MYIATRYTQNQAANTTTVTYSYMLHERNNNFSAYSCTTYLQYKTNGATSYTKSYNPATTIQYTAMTTNRYYWMGNSDGTPAIAFTTIPTSGSVASPTGTFSWTFTVNHGATGTAPTTSVNAYMDSNTNATYVPVGTTATYTMSIPAIAASWITQPAITAYSRPSASTLNVSGTAASINFAANNTITYVYNLYVDGALTASTSALAEGAAFSFSNIAISAAASHSVYVTATASGSTSGASNTVTSPGVPSVATGLSAVETSTQSREVTVYWTRGAENGSTMTSQSVAWSTSPTMVGAVGVAVAGTDTSYVITAENALLKLLPNTTYYYTVTETNAVGSNGTSVYSFTTRPSAPMIVPTAGAGLIQRTTAKIWNGTAWVTGTMMVYDGTSPYNVSGWKYLK